MHFIKVPLFLTYLLHILTFCDPLVAYFNSWMAQALNEVSRVQAHQIGTFVHICEWILFRKMFYGIRVK